MHPVLTRAIDDLDAAVFSGDSFDAPLEGEPPNEDREEFLRMIARWLRGLDKHLPAANLDGDYDKLFDHIKAQE